MEETKVNTMTQSKNKANDILKAIEDSSNQNSALNSQCSSMLLNLIKDSSEDSPLRRQAIDTATFFNESFKELNSIDSKYIKNDLGEELNKWTKINKNIDLIDYVPNGKIKDSNGNSYPNTIDVIKDADGNIYPSKIEDLDSCFVLFKKWIYPKERKIKNINFTEYSEDDSENENKDQDRLKEEFWEYDKRGMFLNHNANDFYYYEWDTDANAKKLDELRSLKKQISNTKAYIENLKKEIKNRTNEYLDCMEYIKRHDENESENENGSIGFDIYYSICVSRVEIYNNMVCNLENQKNNLINQKNKKKETEESIQPEKRKGSYYDDDYLVQRDIRKIHTETIRMIVDTYTTKDWWGRVHTHNTHDNIVKKVEDYTRQTSLSPLFLLEDMDGKIIESQSSNKNCLIKDLNAINNIKKLKDGQAEVPTFFKDLEFCYNDFFNNNEEIVITKDLQDKDRTLLFAADVFSKTPDYLYYENKDQNRFMFVKVLDKEIIPSDPILKNEYKKRYGLCVNSKEKPDLETVKFFVYDNKQLEKFYKDFKFKIRLTLKIEYSDLNLEEQDIKYIPILKIGDAAYINICKNYREKILKDLDNSYKNYNNTPSALRCEDGDPYVKYEEFLDYIKTIPIVNNTIANAFIDYCNGTIYKWASERIVNLIATIDNKENINNFFNILSLRLRKNSGSLLIWYQSLINFDDSYAKNLLSNKVLKNNIKSMFVTTAYNYNDSKLSNSISNPKFIDIEALNEIYDGENFKIGEEVYIFRGKSQHKNRIKSIEYIDIEKFNNSSSETNNSLELPSSLTTTEKVTRLVLEHPLPSWCKTKKPQEIVVCQTRM